MRPEWAQHHEPAPLRFAAPMPLLPQLLRPGQLQAWRFAESDHCRHAHAVEMVFMLRGRICFQVDGTTIEARTGDSVVVPGGPARFPEPLSRSRLPAPHREQRPRLRRQTAPRLRRQTAAQHHAPPRCRGSGGAAESLKGWPIDHVATGVAPLKQEPAAIESTALPMLIIIFRVGSSATRMEVRQVWELAMSVFSGLGIIAPFPTAFAASNLAVVA